MVKVSFVTVTFNNAKGLERTLQSYMRLKKTLGTNNIEIVVVDGDSSDTTPDVIDKFRDSLDVVISESDNGIYDAMNKGVSCCRGDFVNFMNAGDCIVPDGMKKLIENIHANNHVYYGDFVWEGRRPIEFPFSNFHPWFLKMPNHQTIVMPRSFLLDNPFRDELPINADLENKISAYASGLSYIYVPEIVAACEAGGVSQTYEKFDHVFLRGMYAYKVAKRHFGLICGVVNFIKTFTWGLIKTYLVKKNSNTPAIN